MQACGSDLADQFRKLDLEISRHIPDSHINKSIIDAAHKGLGVFVIDPLGSGVLDKQTGVIKPAQDELMGAVQPVLIGASRRPLTATFGGDIVEHQRLSTLL